MYTSDFGSKIYDVSGKDLDEALAVYPCGGKTPRGDYPVLRLRYSDEGATVGFEGILLGYGTSWTEGHTHPPSMPMTGRCSGCRWTDVMILWAHPVPGDGSPAPDDMYATLIRGMSDVPEETQRCRMSWSESPQAALESLTVPAHRGRPGIMPSRIMPTPQTDAVVMAGAVDARLRSLLDDTGYTDDTSNGR